MTNLPKHMHAHTHSQVKQGKGIEHMTFWSQLKSYANDPIPLLAPLMS